MYTRHKQLWLPAGSLSAKKKKMKENIDGGEAISQLRRRGIFMLDFTPVLLSYTTGPYLSLQWGRRGDEIYTEVKSKPLELQMDYRPK